MPEASMETFLKKAQESEKKYDWLVAAQGYEKACVIATSENKCSKAVQLYEQLGFCYFRAAFQAEDDEEFRERIAMAWKTYEREAHFLKTAGLAHQAESKHANAFSAYMRSYLETSVQKRKKLLAEWWFLENQALAAYESAGDLLSIGKMCNRMLEHSNYYRFWLTSSLQERKMILEEGFILAEKAIQILSKLNNIYELARAYCFASWFYSWGDQYWESEDKILHINQKCQEYANKALLLSQKMSDAWLIGWAQIVGWNAAFLVNLNPASGLDFAEKTQKYGRIARDAFLMGFGNTFIAWSNVALAAMEEDPDKQKAIYEHASVTAQEGINNFHKINHSVGLAQAYGHLNTSLATLESIETDPEKKKPIIEKITSITNELSAYIKKEAMCAIPHDFLFLVLGRNFYFLSKTENNAKKKRWLLQKAQVHLEKHVAISEGLFYPFWGLAFFYHELFSAQNDLAKIETNNRRKIKILKQAIKSIERSIEIIEKKRTLYTQSGWQIGFFYGQYYEKLGQTLQKLYALDKEETDLSRAIKAYKKALVAFEKASLPSHMGESYWQIARIYNALNEYSKSAKYYQRSAEKYKDASIKTPQLRNFYEEYSSYMQAWSQIEEARYNHLLEDYDGAELNYEKTAKLHESTEKWSYLASNYFAWAKMEEAEGLSRKENTQEAKQIFQKALYQFTKAEKTIKQKIMEITSIEEREMTQKLLQSSALRRKFCQARIQIEEAKLLDRDGMYLQSSKSYEEAAQNICSIIEKVDFEAERKELEYVATLCRAWGKMANAEETSSLELYLGAASLFEQARDSCYTKKASLWALGNSSFCKGLAAGLRYKSSMDLKENALAKQYFKDAASSYFAAGFKGASEYALATLRLFDAYVFMNQAESEVDPERKARQYQMAENLLQLAAGSFMKAKQPEKTTQVRNILANVKDEKALAISLNQVMQAPSIASSTLSFMAPSPTNEVSVGLEQFQHANVQANLVVGLKEVKVGESFCLSVEFVNAGREPALLTRVEDFVPQDFIVVKKPEIYRLEETCLNMKGKQIAPLKLVEAKLVLQPSKTGVYRLKPTVHYLDELGQSKSLQLKSVEIKVEEVVLEDRISTGTKELDSLLLGGIPEEYAVVLAGPPSDERELIIKNFLEAGIKEGQISFYVATEADGIENLLEKSGFHLFLCNPKPKIDVPDLPNVTKLRSKTDINNLNMALARESRNLAQKQGMKRICVGIVSDVLLEYGSKTARKWLSELITDLGSKGFTILAVLDSSMHPVDQANAVVNSFDGEIRITQTEDPTECRKFLRVKRLNNQEYLKNSACLKI